jgi:hypothetical protein
MDAEVSTHTFLTMIIEESVCFMSCEPIFFCNYSYVVHTEYIFTCIQHFFHHCSVRMNDNLPERVQILDHVHIICITVREDRIICCQIFCDLLLKSAFEWIFNVMQLIKSPKQISTDHHFQNGHHNTAKIQHCPISSKSDMWVHYDFPNLFPTLKIF